ANVTRASGHVEHAVGAGASARRSQLGHHRILPETVHATAHQVIHQVIAVGHIVEDLVDETLLFVHGDSALAEMGSFLGLDHDRTSMLERIARTIYKTSENAHAQSRAG